MSQTTETRLKATVIGKTVTMNMEAQDGDKTTPKQMAEIMSRVYQLFKPYASTLIGGILTPEGRELLKALNSGDLEGAKQAVEVSMIAVQANKQEYKKLHPQGVTLGK